MALITSRVTEKSAFMAWVRSWQEIIRAVVRSTALKYSPLGLPVSRYCSSTRVSSSKESRMRWLPALFRFSAMTCPLRIK